MNKNIISKFLQVKKIIMGIILRALITKKGKAGLIFYAPNNAHFLEVNGFSYIPQIDHLIDDLNIIYGCKSYLPIGQYLNISNEIHKMEEVSLFALLYGRRAAWERILKKNEVKAVAGIGLSALLLRAAQKLNVQTIEIYHGCGYENLKYFRPVPAKFSIVYDDLTLKTLSEFKLTIPVRCRHPYFERREFFRRHNIDLRYQIKNKLNETFEDNGNVNVLVTLQWGYESKTGISDFANILDNGIIHESLISVIKKRKDINWILRWHPVQLRSSRFKNDLYLVERIFKNVNNVAVSGFDNLELIDLMRFMTAHITMSSMSTVEAAKINLRSLVLCPVTKSYGYYKDQVNSGLARYCELSSDSIEIYLNDLLNKYIPDSGFEIFEENEKKYPKSKDVICDVVDGKIIDRNLR